MVGWTCEEFGGVGARQYYEDHKHEAEKMVCVIESDMGAFLPKGLTFTGMFVCIYICVFVCMGI